MRPANGLYQYLVLAAFIIWSMAGCAEQPKDPDAFFVRHGLVVEVGGLQRVSASRNGLVVRTWSVEEQSSAKAYRLGPDRVWLILDWQPGEQWTVQLTARGKQHRLALTAPQRPSPLLVRRIDLEQVDHSKEQMGASPDTEVRFSPDGGRLAMGSSWGWLRVVETLTGREVFSRKLAEGMVKRIAWSKQGDREILYVGEQSPDGFIYCLDAATGREIWRYRTADDIDTAPVSGENTRNRVYNLPGIYQLVALPGGDVAAMGTHGWFRNNKWLTKCVLYGLSGVDGRVKWRWPRQQAFPHSITWFGASADGRVLAFTSHSARTAKKDNTPYPGGTLYCLDGVEGKLRWKYKVPPLKPYYQRAGSWQGVAVAPDGKYLCLGLNDGRAMLFNGRSHGHGPPLWVKELGTPVIVGDIPVAAPVSYAAMTNQTIYLSLPGTIIPASSGSQRNRRPVPHPLSNYLLALNHSGEIVWRWRSPGSAQGISLSRDGRWVATAVTSGRGSRDMNMFGLALFDNSRAGGGPGKLVYHYATEGPLHFQADFSHDGRFIAISEFPYSQDEGKTVYGRYRVHIIH